jgi:predicted DNA-binding transcriptional regulator YafY
VRLLLGWCERRRDLRSSRLDRIQALEFLAERDSQEPGERLVDYLRMLG